jgi:caffeoyl-CoA O-methyltransferase
MASKEGILVPAIDRYVNDILPARDPVLAEMERLAERENIPIIGPACMRLLSLLVQVSGAKRIFEMGSAIGYSAVWLARAAGRGSKIYYTDSDPKNLTRAKAFLRRAGVAGRVEMQLGDALVSFQRTPGTFDMIFIDVNKHQYPEAFRLALPRLRHGGLLAFDNILWSGRVGYKAKAGDKLTRTIQKFNRSLYANKELFPVIVPLRDGVIVCRKR